MRRDYLIGVGLVLLATCGWSLAGLFVRVLPGLNGWQVNTWRGLSVAIALFLYLLVVYRGGIWAKFQEIPTKAMVACAAFFAIGSTLYVTSLTLTSTANVSSIGATSPIFTAILSRAVTGEAPGGSAWAAAFLALAGVVVIVHDGLQTGSWVGNLVSVGTALCFAGQTVTLRRYSSIDMVPAVCVGGIATFLIAGTLGGGFDAPFWAISILALMARATCCSAYPFCPRRALRAGRDVEPRRAHGRGPQSVLGLARGWRGPGAGRVPGGRHDRRGGRALDPGRPPDRPEAADATA